MLDLVALEKSFPIEEHLDMEVKHTFAEGMYIRELFIPKGVLVVGKRHRKKTMNMLVKGKMTIYDEHKSFEVEAPFMAETEPFTKKCGFAHEDSIWVNIHVTNETDLDIIEKQFIIEESEYLELDNKEKKCLG